MNELSNLMITSRRVNYKLYIESLTQNEYKLLLFLVESQERNYNKHMLNHKEFLSIKEKLIENHHKFNKNWEDEERRKQCTI